MGSWDLQQRLGLAPNTSTPHLAASRKVPTGRTVFPKRANSELSRNFALLRLSGKQNPGAHLSKMPCLSPFHFDLRPWPCWSFLHLKSPPNDPALLPASMWDPCTPTFWEWRGCGEALLASRGQHCSALLCSSRPSMRDMSLFPLESRFCLTLH